MTLSLAARLALFLPSTLEAAAVNGDVEKIQQWLEHGGSVEARTTTDESLLELAIRSSQHELLAMLLRRGVAVEKVNASGWTPLIQAITQGNEPAIHRLFEHGANPNTAGIGRWLPLHEATQKNDPTLALLLLDHGADPRIANFHGESFMVFLERQEHLTGLPTWENIALLAQSKADDLALNEALLDTGTIRLELV